MRAGRRGPVSSGPRVRRVLSGRRPGRGWPGRLALPPVPLRRDRPACRVSRGIRVARLRRAGVHSARLELRVPRGRRAGQPGPERPVQPGLPLEPAWRPQRAEPLQPGWERRVTPAVRRWPVRWVLRGRREKRGVRRSPVRWVLRGVPQQRAEPLQPDWERRVTPVGRWPRGRQVQRDLRATPVARRSRGFRELPAPAGRGERWTRVGRPARGTGA